MSEYSSGKSYRTTDRAHRNFSEMLRKKGVKNPVITASFYFDVFFLDAFKIKKSFLVERGLCAEDAGSFGAWRKLQKGLGLLDWTETKLANGKVKITYKPGPKAIPYLNKLTIDNEQLATKADVRKVKDDVQGLRAEVNALKEAMGTLIERFDPPNTEQKMAFYIENPGRLGQLS